MNFLTGKSIPRRTFLQGMGATVALPYLDAMKPAMSRFSGTGSKAVDDRVRFVAIESVHGAAGSNTWGASKWLW